MNVRQVFLFIIAIGLLPIALSYGLIPQKSMSYLYDISISDINSVHIFRAVMCLYLALALFWIIGAFKVQLQQAALYSLTLFMLGLAAGRILSLIIDGIPHWLLVVYLGMELSFGVMGIFLIKRSD